MAALIQASSAGEAAGPAAMWVEEYPAGEIEIFSVCESSEGGYYAGGAGPGGRMVMKIDESGKTVWEKTVPGSDENGSIKLVQESPAGGLILFADGENLVKTGDDAGFEWEFHQPLGKVYSIEVSPDGSGVMAGTYIQGFLTSVSTDGEEAWNRTFSDPEGGGQYVIRSVQNDPSGGFIIAGYIDPIFMITDYRGFLLKTGEEGNKIWARQYSGDASGMIFSVAPRPGGGYAATRLQVLEGEDNSTVLAPSVLFTSPDGSLEKIVYYNESAEYLFHITNAGDAGYYLFGLVTGDSEDDYEYKIIRTGLSGAVLWEKSLGDVELRGFATTSDGGFIIAGSGPDVNNSVLVKYAEDKASEQAPGFAPVTVFVALAGTVFFIFNRKK